jgi:hypothetical protein
VRGDGRQDGTLVVVVKCRRGEDDRRPLLHRAQIREWEGNQHHISGVTVGHPPQLSLSRSTPGGLLPYPILQRESSPRGAMLCRSMPCAGHAGGAAAWRGGRRRSRGRGGAASGGRSGAPEDALLSASVKSRLEFLSAHLFVKEHIPLIFFSSIYS